MCSKGQSHDFELQTKSLQRWQIRRIKRSHARIAGNPVKHPGSIDMMLLVQDYVYHVPENVRETYTPIYLERVHNELVLGWQSHKSTETTKEGYCTDQFKSTKDRVCKYRSYRTSYWRSGMSYLYSSSASRQFVSRHRCRHLSVLCNHHPIRLCPSIWEPRCLITGTLSIYSII